MAAITGLSITSCSEPAPFSFRESLAEAEEQEASNRQDFDEWSADRRYAYENHNVVPTVPSDLSSDPYDPDFAFRGYADAATPEEVMAAELARGAEPPENPGDIDDSPADGEIAFGHFISRAGEIWQWAPEDPDAVIAMLAEARGPDRVDEPANPAGDEDLQPEAGFRNIIGSSDTREIRSASEGHSMTGYPLRTFGALNPDGQSQTVPASGCTATKIGSRHLLTAGHCVNVGGQGENAGWIFRDWWPGQDGMHQFQNGGDPSPNPVKTVLYYFVHQNWLDDSDATDDYAVLILVDNQNSCNLGWIGYEDDDSLATTDHWNWGFPIGSQNCEASEHPLGRCSQSMWGDERTIVRTTGNYAYYYHDTQVGHSGGPLYEIKSGGRYSHVIHSGGYSSVENRGVKITEQVFDNIFGAKETAPSSFCQD